MNNIYSPSENDFRAILGNIELNPIENKCEPSCACGACAGTACACQVGSSLHRDGQIVARLAGDQAKIR